MIRTIISQLPRWPNFVRGRYSIEIGYPWLTPGAIMQLERLTNPNFKVLELGCGGSTIFFSRRFGSVLSLDTSEEWASKVRAKLGENSNVTLITGDYPKLNKIVQDQPDRNFDIVLLDIGGHDRHRYAMGELARPKVRIGGFLVVDNYDTKYMNRLNYTGFEVFTYDELEWSSRGTRICIRRF